MAGAVSMAGAAGLACAAGQARAGDAAPRALPVALAEVEITKDNTVITESCRVRIAPGTVIRDEDGNGVIQIRTSGITVEFAEGSELWGGEKPRGFDDGEWDSYIGTGIRIEGAKGVTLKNARVHGYKVGVWATGVDGLVVDAADLSDNFRQRLRSTPLGEDGADWLFPHHNDKDEWATKWGAAMYVRGAEGTTIKNVRVRRGQNGILLHQVNGSKLYDNDCSFLSGWGVGMFRSSGNTISRNALDFCVRGHVEGVYNRGQDSAGILMFEQCSNNLIVENSVTHGGDGIFGFAGLEALNGEGAPAGYDHTRKGCNDNLFLKNDLSYAPAHGLEMTFSFGNKVIGNRFVENAICGIWGGYSQDFMITGNEFAGNGGMAYGLERGAINMEHASGNTIVGNTFTNNKVAVHLWWDGHGDFETKTWGKANYKGVSGNVIAGNTITIDAGHPFKNLREGQKLLGIHLRQDGAPGPEKFKNNVYAGNTVKIDAAVGQESEIAEGIQLDTGASVPPVPMIKVEVPGNSTPVGARASLRGREKIIMGTWGPWDHQSPMFRTGSVSGGEHVYELFGIANPTVKLDEAASDDVSVGTTVDGPITRVSFKAKSGVSRYSATVSAGAWTRKVSGVLIGTSWEVKAFSWADETDPRVVEKLAAWRALAGSDQAITAKVDAIRFNYGGGGPRNQPWGKTFGDKAPGNDRFGTVATTKLRFPKGKWKFVTLSDDGVRVLANGTPVIENWTWHAPTRNEGVLDLPAETEVELVVEHFEIDGHSVLELEIAPG